MTSPMDIQRIMSLVSVGGVDPEEAIMLLSPLVGGRQQAMSLVQGMGQGGPPGSEDVPPQAGVGPAGGAPPGQGQGTTLGRSQVPQVVTQLGLAPGARQISWNSGAQLLANHYGQPITIVDEGGRGSNTFLPGEPVGAGGGSIEERRGLGEQLMGSGISFPGAQPGGAPGAGAGITTSEAGLGGITPGASTGLEDISGGAQGAGGILGASGGVGSAPNFDLSDLPPTLESIFGDQTANQVRFSDFLTTQMPRASGGFRAYLEGLQPLIESAFAINDILSNDAPVGQPSPNLADFLGNIGVGAQGFGQDALQNIFSMDSLNKLSNLLRGGAPAAQGLGASGRSQAAGSLADLMGLGMNEGGMSPAQAQYTQRDMAMLPQLMSVAPRFRAGLTALMSDMFDSIMARQGENANFQFLPYLQRSGFNFFGGGGQ